jgi:hypothetical protein
MFVLSRRTRLAPLVRGVYSGTNTDELLRRAMEASGDHDPSQIQASTGRPLHFVATDSLDAHRVALHPTDGAALRTGGGVIAGKAGGAFAYEQATGVLAKQILSPLLRAGAGATAKGTCDAEAWAERRGRRGEADRQRWVIACHDYNPRSG